MSKNVVEPERPQITMLNTRVLCWIRSATYLHAKAHAHAPGHPPAQTHARTHALTHTKRVMYCFSTATVVSCTPPHITLYAHCLSCLLLNFANMSKHQHSYSGILILNNSNIHIDDKHITAANFKYTFFNV